MGRKALLLALLLAGCTHTSANMLDERTLAISGSGTAFTNMSQVSQALLRRAATEAQARGFTHFVILGAQDASTTGYYTSPTTTTGSVSGTSSCMGGFCSGQASGTATTYGGQTIAFNRPGADAALHAPSTY